MARQRLNPQRRKALRVRQSLSHNIPSPMGQFESLSHRGYVCQNLAKPIEPLPTIAERLRVKKAHAR